MIYYNGFYPDMYKKQGKTYKKSHPLRQAAATKTQINSDNYLCSSSE